MECPQQINVIIMSWLLSHFFSYSHHYYTSRFSGFKRKDPGIPNLFPFKSEMLKDIQMQKDKNKAEKERAKEEQREKRKRAALGLDDMEDEIE